MRPGEASPQIGLCTDCARVDGEESRTPCWVPENGFPFSAGPALNPVHFLERHELMMLCPVHMFMCIMTSLGGNVLFQSNTFAREG